MKIKVLSIVNDTDDVCDQDGFGISVEVDGITDIESDIADAMRNAAISAGYEAD